MTAASLFTRRLLIFSGKGGTGKSTVTAAVAVAAARLGRRVLIVEVGEHERISGIFDASPVGYRGGVVYRPRNAAAPPITAMCITATEALREYGMRTVKFNVIYNAVFDNPVIRYFAAAAPAVEELNLLGKIESLQREAFPPAPHSRFDLMLLDAPATGHALALLESPQLAMRLSQAGPIYAMVERMWKLITDPARTAFNIVTLPEEMPVNESIELDAAARALGIPRGIVVVNGMYPDLFTADELDRVPVGHSAAGASPPLSQRIVDAARSVVRRRREQDAMTAQLREAIPVPQLVLPLIISPRIGADEIEALADRVREGSIDA